MIVVRGPLQGLDLSHERRLSGYATMSSTAAGPSDSSRYLDFDEYVDLKLQKTRSTIKSTDILVALAGVAAMFLGYLLVFVVFDQWVVPGGFGIGLRWALLSTLL